MKFENDQVWGFEHALRGMRNPLESWGKSDSYCRWAESYTVPKQCQPSICSASDEIPHFVIGPNDLALAQKLIKAGSEHRKFMRQIFVSVDITAPLYWWKEFDTYKVGTVANSCSTMHRIHSKEFKRNDFSCENLDGDTFDLFDIIIFQLNRDRERFLKTGEEIYWWQMIQLLPSSYNQKRTITMNYENLYGMVKQREGHKLTEWSKEFMEWVEFLPYAKELIFIE